MDDTNTPMLEAMIADAPDGLLHTIPLGSPKKSPKRRGIEAKRSREEADICLNCPLEICELDENTRCKRYSKIRRETKKK